MKCDHFGLYNRTFGFANPIYAGSEVVIVFYESHNLLGINWLATSGLNVAQVEYLLLFNIPG